MVEGIETAGMRTNLIMATRTARDTIEMATVAVLNKKSFGGMELITPTGKFAEEKVHICEFPNSADCTCAGCIINYRLPKHPNYLRDQDDDFDSTYATIYFSIPPEMKELASKLESGEFKPVERWHTALEGLKNETLESIKAKYPEIAAVLEQITHDNRE